MRLGRADQQDRAGGGFQHFVGDTAEDQPPEPATPVRRHRDQAGAEIPGPLYDRLGGRAFRVLGLDVEAGLTQPAGYPRQVRPTDNRQVTEQK